MEITDLEAAALVGTKAHSSLAIKIQIVTATGPKPVGSGRIQSLAADQDFGMTPVHGVGDYEPAEFAPTRFGGTLTLDAFRIRTEDLVALKIAALGKAILQLPIFKLQAYDKVSGAVYRTWDGCVISRYSERIQEGAIAGENATVLYQTVRNGP